MKIKKIDLINKIMILQICWILFFGIAYSYFPKIALLTYFPDLLNGVLIICILDRMKKGLRKEYIWIAIFVMRNSRIFMRL